LFTTSNHPIKPNKSMKEITHFGYASFAIIKTDNTVVIKQRDDIVAMSKESIPELIAHLQSLITP